jgi:hypothetical protein
VANYLPVCGGRKAFLRLKCQQNPHKSGICRTDGFMPARTEIWLARNSQLSAQIEFCPHEPENGRTERFIAARKRNFSAQIDFDVVARDFCPHEIISLRSVF